MKAVSFFVLIICVFVVFPIFSLADVGPSDDCNCNIPYDTSCPQGYYCSGTESCVVTGSYGDQCVRVLERCNGNDDDVDGQTDEGCDDDTDGYSDIYIRFYDSEDMDSIDFGDCHDVVGENSCGNNCNPSHQEICDGFDNNCNDDFWAQYWNLNNPDGIPASFVSRGIDENFDADGDTVTTCGTYTTGNIQYNRPHENHQSEGPDCDDSDPSRWKQLTYYSDADNDGYGASSGTTTTFCVGHNTAVEGWSLDNTDCDDTNPEAWELIAHYPDTDADGCGSANATPSQVCGGTSPAEGWSFNRDDCDDQDNLRCGNFYEICDGVDSDCDGQVIDEEECDFFEQYVYENNPLARVVRTYSQGITDVFVENNYATDETDILYTFSAVYDELRNPLTTKIDQFGDTVMIRDALGNTQNIVYDSVGRLDQITDASNRLARKEKYNTLSQLVWSYSLDSGEKTYVYDDNGNLLTMMVFNNPDTNSGNNAGQEAYRVNHEYDYKNRLVRSSYVSGQRIEEVFFYYDSYIGPSGTTNPAQSCIKDSSTSFDKLCKIVGRTTITYLYDRKGNVLEVKETIPDAATYGTPSQTSIDKTTRYEYSYSGAVKKIIYPNGLEVDQEYDSLGKLISLADQNGLVDVAYEFGDENEDGEKVGKLKKTSSPDFDTDYSYNECGHLAEITNPHFRENYAYDDVGNVISITDQNSHTAGYSYDSIYRLIHFDNIGDYYLDEPFNVTYSYDQMGNMLSRQTQSSGVKINRIIDASTSFSYGTDNKLDSAGDCTYIYDYEGKLVKQTCSYGRCINYDYYLDGFLKQIQISSLTEKNFAPNSGFECGTTTLNGNILPEGYSQIATGGVVSVGSNWGINSNGVIIHNNVSYQTRVGIHNINNIQLSNSLWTLSVYATHLQTGDHVNFAVADYCNNQLNYIREANILVEDNSLWTTPPNKNWKRFSISFTPQPCNGQYHGRVYLYDLENNSRGVFFDNVQLERGGLSVYDGLGQTFVYDPLGRRVLKINDFVSKPVGQEHFVTYLYGMESKPLMTFASTYSTSQPEYGGIS